MRIHVGSKNEVKVGAVREVAAEYPCIAGADIVGVDAPSGVASQPTSLDETIRGAINRAKACFDGAELSFGIESGIVPVPHTKTGHMDVTACVIWDGREHHLGLSSLFECPKDVTDLILSGECDMQTAFLRCGYTANPSLGSAEGAIGILTKGRVTRKDYTMQALRMALIHLERERVAA
ncbi:MAG TPA: inosine/xanthosine triphosphatase [Candidatus Binatia bacterium]|jgi:inosine/xanthosine triphosphatase|nr:inosine/xanthosine triphosphatase [Candidatus Binatia bacterium]